MKNLFFTLILLLTIISVSAQQKAKLSFIASPSLNWMGSDVKEVERGQAVFGYDFGIDADFLFKGSENYSFSTGILITSAGGEMQYQTEESFHFADAVIQPATKIKYELRYVEIPILIKMRTSQFHRNTYWGQFGISGMVNIGAKGTTNDAVLEKTNISDEVNMFNVALNVGLGFEYDLGGNNAITCGIIFKNGFFDITDNKDIDGTTTMNTLKLKLGIVF